MSRAMHSKICTSFWSIMLLSLIVFSTVQLGSGTILYDSTFKVIVIQDEPSVNITDIYYAINDDSIIRTQSEDGLWLINAGLHSKNSTVYINNTDVSELRLTGNVDKRKMIYGWNSADRFSISNVSISGWNLTANKPEEGGGILLYNSEFHDVSIRNSKEIKICDNVVGDISNITISSSGDFWIDNLNETSIYNIKIYSAVPTSVAAFCIMNSESLTIHDVTVNKTLLNGMYCSNMRNSEFYNISISHAGSYLNPSTGYLGILLSSGSNNYGHDLFINDTGWSSLCPTDCENGSLLKDIFINNSGHNGLDIHPASNILVENITVHNSVSNNVLITAGYHQGKPGENITVNNAYLKNAGVQMGVDIHNITLSNMIIENGGIKSLDMSDLLIINTTIVNSSDYREFDNFITFTKLNGINTINGCIIDSSFYRLDSWIATNSKAINVDYDLLWGKDNLSIYYYPDIVVRDESGFSEENAQIRFVNEVSSSIEALDGYGYSKSIFLTKSNGQTYLPNEDRTKSPALATTSYFSSPASVANSYSSSPKYDLFTHSATITTTDNRVLTLSNITPDPSWYRADPNVPTYTITAIIPDESTGPHITGFAPSESNPFIPEESKIFRVWTDEPLSEMNWYVDGFLVSEGSMNYTWLVEEGGHTIEFEGSNSNRAVNQIWNIEEGSNPVLTPAVKFFPEDSSFTQNAGESITFNANSDQPLSATNWYIDGELVQSNTTSITYNWDSPGTYNVTVGGVSDESPISNTWMITVIDHSSNTAPVLNSIGAKQANETGMLSFNLSATDPDDDSLTFSATNLPESATLDPSSGDFSWTPSIGQAGTYYVTFSVSDGSLTDSETVKITVNEPSIAPVIDSFNPGDSQFFEETNTITINASAHDDNGDDLSYTISIDSVVRSTSSEYIWKTDYKSAGIHTIEVTVSDGTNTVSESHQINIIEVHPRWDVNNDGIVDDEDIAIISEKFGTKTNKPHPRWDINQDGIINIQDLTLAGSNYGETVA